MNYARKITLYHNRPNTAKLKYIVKFGDKDWVNSSNFNDIVIKFSETFYHPLLHVFIFCNTFLRVTVLLLCWLQAESKIQLVLLLVLIYPYLIWEGRRNSCNTCKNGWTNFSTNLRILVLKLPELTRFTSPNKSIYCNFVRCWGSVVMLTFLNYPPICGPII